MYAGCRSSKNCHPNELLRPNGYNTSSKMVLSLIKLEGIDSFEILRIDTNCDGLSPYAYETLFLEVNDCANSDGWYNYHNNNGWMVNPMHDNKIVNSRLNTMKSNMMDKYGVNHNMSLPGVSHRITQSRLLKWKNSSTGRSPIYGKRLFINTNYPHNRKLFHIGQNPENFILISEYKNVNT